MKTLKNVMNKAKDYLYETYQKCKSNIVITTAAITSSLVLNTGYAFAEEGKETTGSNTASIDPFITFVCDWLLKIGGIIALIGGVMFALGWQREDAEGKSRGLMTLMAGFMLVALSQAPSIFGL